MLRYIRSAKWIMYLLTLFLLLSGMYVPGREAGIVPVYSYQKEASCVLDALPSVDVDMDLCSDELFGSTSKEYSMRERRREGGKTVFVLEHTAEGDRNNTENDSVFFHVCISDAVLGNSDYDSVIQYIHNQDGSKG